MAQSLLPPDYQAQMQDVERQRALAMALQNQGMQPLQARKAGRFVVAPSPLEGLAKVMQTYAGTQAGKQADTRGQEIVRQAGEARSNTLAQALARAQGAPEIPQPPAEIGGGPGRAAVAPDPQGGMNILAQSPDPQLSAFGLQNMMPKRPEPYTLGPGQTRYDPQGNPVASVPAATPQPRVVAPGGVVLGPDNKPIFTNPQKPERERQPQIIQTDKGPMILGDDGRARPITDPTGTPVRPAAGRGGPMTATAQKELIETEEQIQGGNAALDLFKQAKALNDQAMGFTGAGALASAGSLLPSAIRPNTIEATQNLDNILQTAALPQLKAIFGGMPTEGERKILLDVQGSSSKPASVRKDIFDRAEKAIQARIKFAGEKAKRLREGTYFTGEGLPSLQMPGLSAPSGSQDSSGVIDFSQLPSDRRGR